MHGYSNYMDTLYIGVVYCVGYNVHHSFIFALTSVSAAATSLTTSTTSTTTTTASIIFEWASASLFLVPLIVLCYRVVHRYFLVLYGLNSLLCTCFYYTDSDF